MEEIAKKYLIDDKELYKKYLRAERKYYKKLDDKYATIQLNIDLDDKTIKKLFAALAKTEICFDDFIVCILKEEIVRKEMEKA